LVVNLLLLPQKAAPDPKIAILLALFLVTTSDRRTIENECQAIARTNVNEAQQSGCKPKLVDEVRKTGLQAEKPRSAVENLMNIHRMRCEEGAWRRSRSFLSNFRAGCIQVFSSE
jgi:hypothetical protein